MTKMSAQSQQPTVVQIGQMFVKQYYLLLNSDPQNVHRFYREDSLFAHGGNEIGSTETIVGQKAIHEKIMQLDFSEVHARIKQVDSQATLDTGILVQVTGEISTHRNPMRNFVQTFILRGKDRKQYYVCNDIFRYQEPVEYDYTSESENNENQSDRGEVVGSGLESTTAAATTYPAPQPQLQQQSAPPTEAEQRSEVPEEPQDLAKQKVPLPEPVVPAGENSSSWGGYNGRPQPDHEVVAAMEPAEPYVPPASMPADPPPSLLSPQQQQSPAAGPLTSTTWAARVSRPGPGPTPVVQPATVTPKRQQQPLPPREAPKPQKKPTEQPSRSPPTAPSAAVNKERLPNKKGGGPPSSSFQVPDSQQIFIGGLPPDVGEEDVKNVFADFSNIIEVRLNQKNFGFVVFDSAEAVQRILERKATRPFFIRSKNINIEPKKANSQRGPGAFPGRRSGDSGGPRGNAGSVGPRKNFKN